MNAQECAESLRNCFKGNWHTMVKENEKIAFEVGISPSSSELSFVIRLKPNGQASITVNGRALVSCHSLLFEIKRFPPSWNSIFNIVKTIRTTYYHCSGITDESILAFYDSDSRPPTIKLCDGAGGKKYAHGCTVLIRRPQGGSTTPACGLCRQSAVQLQKLSRQATPIRTVKRFANYSRADIDQKVEQKNNKIRDLSRRMSILEHRLQKLEQLRKRPTAVQCLDLMNEEIRNGTPSIPPIAALIMQQQFKAHSLPKLESIRWDAGMIDWSLKVHSKSSLAYNFIRKSGGLRIPAPKTLVRAAKELLRPAADSQPENRPENTDSPGLNDAETSSPKDSAEPLENPTG